MSIEIVDNSKFGLTQVIFVLNKAVLAPFLSAVLFPN